MAQLVTNPLNRILDASGNPVSGGKAYFYATGTLTPATVYADSARSTPLSNPVVADGGGLLPNIYLGTSTYRIVFTTAADVTIRDVDPFSPAGDSAADISYLAAGTGASARDVSNKLSDIASAFDYIPSTYHTAILNGSTTQDVTAFLADAVAAEKKLLLPPGLLRITDELAGASGAEIEFSPNTTLRQYTKGKSAFVFTSKSNAWVRLNGGAIRGPLGYNDGGTWTGNSGHEGYRGVRFRGCTNAGIIGNGGRIFAFGAGAVEINGGTDIWVSTARLEGTNAYGETVAADANFQNGIYVLNDATYGGANDVLINNCVISGFAQGYLREAYASPTPSGGTTIVGTVFKDIPGQHGIYEQDGFLTVAGCQFHRINTSAVKIQSGDANRNLYGFNVSGVEAYDIGGSLFEIATLGTGSINAAKLQGVGYDVGYLVSLNGKMNDVDVDVSGSVMANAAILAGANLSRCTVKVNGSTIAGDGVVCTSTSSEVELDLTLANLNTGNATLDSSALRVTFVSGDGGSSNPATNPTTVNVKRLKVTDASGNLDHVIKSVRAASTINVEDYDASGYDGTEIVIDAGTVNGPGWISWTPTYSADSGTLTTVTTNVAKYKRVSPKTVAIELDVTFTDAGTGSGQFIFTLPFTAAQASALSGFDQLTTGYALRPAIRPGALTACRVTDYAANSVIGTGRRIVVTGTYETV